jgi:hypothetical protein
MSERHHLPERLDRLQRHALVLGVIGLLIGGVGCFVNRAHFANAWLVAWFFWLGIALGGLAITMLHHLTGGDWGIAIRRECEAVAMTLPLLAVLFVPIAISTPSLFPWGNPGVVAGDRVLMHQSVYFNNVWLLIRAIIYFAVWCLLAWLLWSQSIRYQQTADFAIVHKMRKVSAFGLLVFTATVSLAAFDWIMSREAHFYSTIIGLMVAVGMTLSALVFVVSLLAVLDDESELLHFLTPPRLNDIGNLLLTLVILWAYLGFAQFLIIWMGNIKPETPWYIHRGLGAEPNGWRYVGLLLVVGQFFAPFLLLLFRNNKRHLPFLAALAMAMLVLRLIDVLWLVAPSGPPRGARVTWMEIPLTLGIGGIWFYLFVGLLRRRPLLVRPEDDPEHATGGAEIALDGGGHRA